MFLPHASYLEGRQLITLELAKSSQTILIDGLILRTTYARNVLGPWLTIFCFQSKGLPFIAIAWSFWDLILLQGEGKFQHVS